MDLACIVAAAGLGLRVGGNQKKQFLCLGGKPLLVHTLEALSASPLVSRLVVVVPPEEVDFCRQAVVERYQLPKVQALVGGGKERQDSVYNGLKALSPPPEWVLIHDGVRPFVNTLMIQDCLEGARETGAAVCALPAYETVKEVDSQGVVTGTQDRSRLWLVQTPQVFRYSLILEAHQRAQAEGYYATDDAALVERLGGKVKVVQGSHQNIKITTAEDFQRAEVIMAASGGEKSDIRVGIGFDIHRLTPGRNLILGGVEIPHSLGLAGDSDADVLCHAIIDALLGAAGLGDIGQYFGVGLPHLMGVSSLKLLTDAYSAVKNKGFMLHNLDATLVAQNPKVGPYLETMKARIAATLEEDTAKLNIKATTGKGIGTVGREEGMAAYAVVSLRFKS